MPPLAVPSEDFHQPMTLQTTIDPISQGAGSVSSAWIPASQFEGLVALIQTGVLGASATVDAKLRQATDAAGSGAKDLSPAMAITQIVKASGDNKQAVIVVRNPKNGMDIGGGFLFVSLQITVGVAASQVAGSLFGVWDRYRSQRSTPLPASVVQLVG